MKVFRFDHHLVENYERFSRSFSTIRARDLFEAIDAEYRQGRFWPDALLSLNPRYRPGPWIADLAADGTLDEATARVFRFRSEEHTSELQSRENLVCRLLLEKKK